MVRYIYVAALCFLILSASTCSKSTEPEQEKTTDPFGGSHVTQAELAAAESTLSAASLDFGLRLFREVVAQSGPTDNVFISCRELPRIQRRGLRHGSRDVHARSG